ncbi:MAG: hemolysin III family protein [Treponema sp.]|jgi:hemolysin III|nr:hemolysin III family protein [Treponema sp.]
MNTINKSPKAVAIPLYSIGEEISHSIIHGLGVLGAIAGLVLLNLKTTGILSGNRETHTDIAAALLFTVTMTGMFLVSTFYHAIQHKGAKSILRKMDHSMIFIFIAGTYTPFCLSGLQGAWGWSIFAIEWALAVTGITLNIINYKSLRKIEIAAYIMMGWVIIIGIVPLLKSVPIDTVVLLIVGGITYTAGVFWYRKKNLKYTHAVWHMFVVLGAVFHWFAVWNLFY